MDAAVILSGGTGTRLGADIPKQYIEINGTSILEYTLTTFIKINEIDVIVIVLSSEWVDYVEQFALKKKSLKQTILYAEPGETRQLSIMNGLNKLYDCFDNIERVVIHDAARPNVSIELIKSCLDTCGNGYDGALPIIPVKDTIYVSKDGNSIDDLLDRTTLYAGQSPEAFLFDKYLDAHKRISFEELKKINGSSELAFGAGMKIKLIPGEPQNYKITDKQDLEQFRNEIV